MSSLLADYLADHDIEEVLVYRRSLEIEAAQTAAVKRSDVQLAAIRVSRGTLQADHRALLGAIEQRDVRHAAHSMTLHADRDLGIQPDMLQFAPRTERAETLIEAGLEPRIGG